MPAPIASPGPSKVTVLPSSTISPSVGVEQPVEHVHQRRLAGAVLPEEAVDLARLDGQVDLVVGREDPNRLVRPLISSRIGSPPHRCATNRLMSQTRQAGAVRPPDLSSQPDRYRSMGQPTSMAPSMIFCLSSSICRRSRVDVGVRTVRREADAVVLQRAVVGLVAEVAARRVQDRLVHGDVHALDDRGQQRVAVLLGRVRSRRCRPRCPRRRCPGRPGGHRGRPGRRPGRSRRHPAAMSLLARCSGPWSCSRSPR